MERAIRQRRKFVDVAWRKRLYKYFATVFLLFFLLRGYGSADTRQRFHLDHRRTEYGRPEVPEVAFDIYTALQHSVSRHCWKILGLKKGF